MKKEQRGNGSRSSTAPNDRRRITMKTPLEGHDSDKTTVAVTTHESLEGFREKAMRIASIDELETGSSAERCSSPGGAVNDKVKKANEIVRDLVGQVVKKGEIVVASDSTSKLCRRCKESRVSIEGVHQQ